MKLGIAIRKIRKKKNIGQGELANKLNISQTHISLIESDKKNPSLDLLKEIANVLEVPLYYIMFNSLEVEVDIKEEKREAYKKVSPAINSLIEEFFIS